VFEQVLKQTHAEPWFEKIRKVFGGFIKHVGLFGVSVTFSPPRNRLTALVGEFAIALRNVVEKIRNESTGLIIILDDIDGLANEERFANWLKSLVDSVATQRYDFPVFFILCGLPERRHSLCKLQPSLRRVFRVVEVDRLTDDEVEHFLHDAFGSVNTEIKPDAMRLMVSFSSGLPALMHEIGDATYWVDTDGVVGMKDVFWGIKAAAQRVGRKELDRNFYNTIRSELYKAILRKLVTHPTIETFSKSELEMRLREDERKVFPNFIRRMRNLGVIEPDLERGRGAYRFVNRIFPVHIYMQARM